MKVYVVRTSDHDDSDTIVAVRSTREAADAIAAEHDGCFWGLVSVEECEVDGPVIAHDHPRRAIIAIPASEAERALNAAQLRILREQIG